MDKSGEYAYHFTCLDNLSSIIKHGLLSTSEKLKLGITHRNVANLDIQCTRSTMSVTCGPGGVVHDYVPFYFSKKTPMQLSLILSKNYDQFEFIYFAIPVNEILKDDVVFTDGSANRSIPPVFYDNLDDIDVLDKDLIRSIKWARLSDSDKHHKMAELLVFKKVDLNRIHHINVWNESVKKEVESYFKSTTCPKIDFDGYHFFCKAPEFRQSYITGPKFLKHLFEETLKKIHIAKDPHSPKFYNIEQFISAIEKDFSCIPELENIEGLKPKSDGVHVENVGQHSRTVVKNIKNNPLFDSLKPKHQHRLILAGYLHDIGKGNSQKDGCYLGNPDHAKESLPMLKRILTQDIAKQSKHCIRQILLLVTYDDLIGDIVKDSSYGYPRNKTQLFELVKNKSELKMLRVLADADIKAVRETWLLETQEKIDELYEEALERFKK